MVPGAAVSDSVLERPLWGRMRYFGGWGVFAAALGAAIAVLLSDERSAGLRDAVFLTPYGARPLRGALLVALTGPLIGAWVGALVPLARRGTAGGVLLGLLGLVPLLVVRAVVSTADWGWEDAPGLAGTAVGAAALGYFAHLSFVDRSARRAGGTPPGPAA